MKNCGNCDIILSAIKFWLDNFGWWAVYFLFAYWILFMTVAIREAYLRVRNEKRAKKLACMNGGGI